MLTKKSDILTKQIQSELVQLRNWVIHVELAIMELSRWLIGVRKGKVVLSGGKM